MMAGRVQSTGRRDQPIQIGLTVSLLGVDLIIRLLNNFRAYGGGEEHTDGRGPLFGINPSHPNRVVRPDRWTPFHELPLYLFILLSES